jgi:predicted metal-dependent phosphoesterase TrpH|tara:strand:+ start:8404 stop:9234 length:831 start_codon:yes stop_codon:yes gene_type:complete
MFADLHIHTNFSDGIYSPKEIITQALIADLKKISITDHDIFLGNIEAKKIITKNNLDIEIISGVEFSCFHNGTEFHIIGLFIDFDNLLINSVIDDMQNKRIESIKNIIEHLRSKNIHLNYNDILSYARGSIGRPHIGKELVNKGYAKDINQAFDKYLSNNLLEGIREPRLPLEKAIDAINNAGGLSILAHPDLSNKKLFDYIKEMKKFGLKGIEVSSPRYGLFRQKEIIELSNIFQLLQSGGSDFHGFHKGIDISKVNGLTEEEYCKILNYKKDND